MCFLSNFTSEFFFLWPFSSVLNISTTASPYCFFSVCIPWLFAHKMEISFTLQFFGNWAKTQNYCIRLMWWCTLPGAAIKKYPKLGNLKQLKFIIAHF